MKKRVVALLLAAVMVFALCACGQKNEPAPEKETEKPTSTEESKTPAEEPTPEEEQKTEGFVVGLSNGYWGNTWRAQMVEDFETKAKEYVEQGILSDYMVSNTNSDATEQLNQINAMIDAGVDAILIDAVSPTTVKPAVEKALAQDILVVIANDPAAYEGTICVCGDNYTWQRIQALWLVEQLEGKGDIVKITGVSGNSADTMREQANDDILAGYPDINVLAAAPGNWSQTDAQSVMTTYLSTYDNIDAVLEQDVMAEGVLKAYDNAGKVPPIMTGDYTKSFLTKWSQNPDLNTIGVPYAPGNATVALEVAVRLLQGKELDESQLRPNPMDETLVNSIYVEPPYVVTREAQPDAPWMEGLKTTKAISLDEALELLADKADTAALDGYMSEEDVDTLFK